MKKKSEDNIKAGKLCKENQMYSAAINIYYYSILQLMLYILDKKGLWSEEDAEKANTHSNAKEKILKLIKEKIL
ncbi:MAG TPA: hypothetical protein PK079_23445 [Leptospiraceae bacterium]|nr:hypothetical protein [Leptospiraceae bacterium]HMW07610.1 hypothetical protein [Leptospiraceae bacterium]HMX33012.1 hypothetical protein [Leptospiraceae bacterium]HMY33271.1 hypothetical protein [Leptospiraceae bacterium]HMZ67286.1 hypothetical protein [Leptospiraceae bacterium]